MREYTLVTETTSVLGEALNEAQGYEKNRDLFVKQVNEMIKQGWQPVGGICVSNLDSENWTERLYQAMVR